MLNFSFKSVIWSVVFLLLLLSLITPLSVLTVFFMLVPGVILYAYLSVKSFALHLIPVAIILFMIEPLYLIFLVVFTVPAIVMGNAIKKGKSALYTFLVGTGAILAEYLLMLLIGSVLFQFNLYEYIENMVKLATEPLTASDGLVNGFVWTPEMTEDVARRTQLLIPFALVVTALVMSLITHLIARPILNVMGVSVANFPPAREWRMPRALIWYYFLALIFTLMSSENDGSYWSMIAANLSPLINLGFMIQAIGFFFFLSHAKKWNPVIPYLLAAAVFFIGPLRIIGVIDLVFPLREAITKPKR